MTYKQIAKFDGIKDVVKRSKSIRGVGSWLPIYINYDEQRIKTEKESDDDYFLTQLIRPCTKDEVIETVVHMTAM